MYIFNLFFALAVSSAVSAGILLPLGDGVSPYHLRPRQATTTTSSPTSSATVADSACTNGPFTRQCWGNGYSIATNYDAEWPVTGKTKTYSIDITNTTGAPDGFTRMVLGINGKTPGDPIIADWGDELEITVTNKMQDNGTSIHWHGIRQWHTSHMDGANGVTECPIAPGESRTYRFLCTQFGTTWFHSHYSAQYGDGVVGTIIINGPATSNYDIDLGTMTLTDWYYPTASQLEYQTLHGSFPPTAANGLINGSMVSPDGTAGSYHLNTITKGKKYRIRLVNTSVDSMFRVSLDNHNFTVITADFVPLKPYTGNWIFLAIGQRIDVIITANQAVGNYWFRAEVQPGCGTNANNGNIKSIFRYAGADEVNPTSTATPYTQSCADETNLVPYVALNVPQGGVIPETSMLNVSFAVTQTVGNQTLAQWNLNATSIQVTWGDPTLQYVLDDDTAYPKELNLITLPDKNAWSIWIIQQTGATAGVAHPIHLHGHDFYLLGTGSGVFSSSTATLKYNNPPRRDVALLPGNGWLVLAFITDNPGAWLMHCHIAWHISGGLGAQFLERSSDIIDTLNIDPQWKTTCTNWNSWYATSQYKQEGSGL